MYNERKDDFMIKDIVLQIAFVVLFVFLLLWLFPTKSYLESTIKPANQTLFNDNVQIMKEAGQSYFTTPRLPSKVGDKVTITLGEMIGKKLVLPIYDENNKACSITKSYVEVTKTTDEYVIKVNLSCLKKADYILVHAGCYNYCETTLCEKVVTPVVVKPIVKPIIPIVKPIIPIVSQVYEYEYSLRQDGYWTPWSEFTAWTITRETTNDTKREEAKTVSEFDKYTYSEVKTGTKEVFDHYDTINVYGTKQVAVYKTETYVTGTKQVATGTYTAWSTAIRKEYTSPKASTTLTRYAYVATRKELSCESTCLSVNIYVYDVSTRSAIYTTENVYGTRQVVDHYNTETYITGTKQVAVNKTVDVFTTVTTSVYKDVTYYRYSTRSYVNGLVSIKWSRSKTDVTLTSQGYTLTGASRIVK